LDSFRAPPSKDHDTLQFEAMQWEKDVTRLIYDSIST
jgi:hypothetical protein